MNNEKGRLNTAPSFFDIGLYLFTFLCPIFFIPKWNLNMVQSLFFVFGVFALLAISFFCKREREFKSIPLACITLWSLAMVFIHSFNSSLSESYASGFISFCLLSEGFIYVLCACILYWLIVTYKKNFNIFYPIIALNILNLVFALTQSIGFKFIWPNNMSKVTGMMGIAPHLVIFSALSLPIVCHYKSKLFFIPVINMLLGFIFWSKSFSGFFAFFVAIAIYLFYHRDSKLFLWFVLGLAFIFIFKNYFFAKAFVRFNLYLITLKEILLHPFLGYGFDNTLANNTVLTKWGWMYRHNDYLNIAKDLGVPFLIFILYTIKDSLKKVRFDYLVIAIIVLMISSSTWTSMYFTRLAIFSVIMLSLKKVEQYG